jgi:hypothetical protein
MHRCKITPKRFPSAEPRFTLLGFLATTESMSMREQFIKQAVEFLTDVRVSVSTFSLIRIQTHSMEYANHVCVVALAPSLRYFQSWVARGLLLGTLWFGSFPVSHAPFYRSYCCDGVWVAPCTGSGALTRCSVELARRSKRQRRSRKHPSSTKKVHESSGIPLHRPCSPCCLLFKAFPKKSRPRHSVEQDCRVTSPSH